MEVEQEQQEETRRMRQQLEDSKRENSRLGLERDELARNMEEREKDRDALRKENTQLDEQRRQQERALDKLNKEVCVCVTIRNNRCVFCAISSINILILF